MAWTDNQISLVRQLRAYESAQAAAQMFPAITAQQAKADSLHLGLSRIALACGFEPNGHHAEMSVEDFCRRRAAVLARTFPNHLREEGL